MAAESLRVGPALDDALPLQQEQYLDLCVRQPQRRHHYSLLPGDAMSDQQPVIDEFRANDGRVGGHLGAMSLLLLNTLGAKSGRRRTTPLTSTGISRAPTSTVTESGY